MQWEAPDTLIRGREEGQSGEKGPNLDFGKNILAVVGKTTLAADRYL